MKLRILTWLVVLMLLAACGGAPATGTPSVLPSASPTEPQLTPVTATSTPDGPITLHIWVPLQFDPQSGTQAGQILQAQLDEFVARRPKARLDVRIKAEEGPGGLLDSLTTASAAAPLALPDLVALPRAILEAAALKGLLRPLDDLSSSMDSQDWYEYARQLSRLQDSTFGLPFAGDALTLVYRSTVISEPPATISETLAIRGPLAFPAADPQALFTLQQYQAAGGATLDEQGRPYLDVNSLNQVLTFFHQAGGRELTPYWLTQFQTDDQAWESFLKQDAEMVVTWTSRYLNDMQADMGASPLPTPDGMPHTLATGWVWALVSPNPEHHLLSAQLAEFLTEPEFLARWDTALGYLPPRSGAMGSWQTVSLQTYANQIVQSSQILPSADVLTSLALPLQQATVEVIKQQTDPLEAAQQAASSLIGP